MLRFYTETEQESFLQEPPDVTDSVRAAVAQAMLANDTPLVAVHPEKSVRLGFLDGLVPELLRGGIRPIQVMSLDGGEIDLPTLMDQVVGRVCDDPIERLELCHDTLTTLAPAETRIALIIDDAHLLTDQSVRYLDLMLTVSRSGDVPLQVMLLGNLSIWDQLPQSGALSADNVARRITLVDAPSEADIGAPNPDQVSVDVNEDSDADPAVAMDAPKWQVEKSLPMVATAGATQADPNVVHPSRFERSRFALAACVGLFAVTGGLAVDLLLDGPFRSLGVTPPLSLAEARQLLWKIVPASASHAAQPDTANEPAPIATVASGVSAATDGDAAVGAASGAQPAVSGASVVADATPDDAQNVASAPGTAEVTRAQSFAPVSDGEADRALSTATGSPHVGPAMSLAVDRKNQTESATSAVVAAVASAEAPGAVAVAPTIPAAAPVPLAMALPVAEAVPAVAPAGPPAVALSPAGVPATPPIAALVPTDAPMDVPAVAVTPPAIPVAPLTTGTTGIAAAIPAAHLVLPARGAMPVVEAVPAPAASNALSPLPVSPLPLSSSAPAGPRLSPELIAVLIARGEALLASGDVTAARLMYSRAADSDSAEGAIAMGMTFDPKVLSQIGVLGPQADPQHAISWYQRAAALGSSEARRLLIQLRGGDQ